VPLKRSADDALRQTDSVQTVIVYQRIGGDYTIHMQEGRDLWWHDLMQTAPLTCPAEPMDSEDLLYLLYTSGSTGKPKGIMHTTGGLHDGRDADRQVGCSTSRTRMSSGVPLMSAG
jgi:acetyl-coenzyme A synthetase (EC 6.2.1.1)